MSFYERCTWLLTIYYGYCIIDSDTNLNANKMDGKIEIIEYSLNLDNYTVHHPWWSLICEDGKGLYSREKLFDYLLNVVRKEREYVTQESFVQMVDEPLHVKREVSYFPYKEPIHLRDFELESIGDTGITLRLVTPIITTSQQLHFVDGNKCHLRVTSAVFDIEKKSNYMVQVNENTKMKYY